MASQSKSMLEKVGVAGWKSKKTAYLEFYRCPECSHLQEMLWGSNGLAQCFGCDKSFPRSAFTTAKARRTVAVCNKCGADVPFTESYFGVLAGFGYICPACNGYVGVVYGEQTVNPITVLQPDWNPKLRERGELVERNLTFARCRTKKDYLVVQVLQAIVKEEDSRFLFVRDKEQSAGLLLDAAKKKYLGFLVWNESDGFAVLRQIFTVANERRKGFAEAMVAFWVQRYADKVNDKFGVEGPNDKAINLHLKLGHMIEEGESVKGVKCFLVPTM